jgi:phosphopantetheinyl transferase
VASILAPLAPAELALGCGASLALLVPFPGSVQSGSVRTATVRALVRRLLGQLMHVQPDALPVARTQRGKPYVEGANAIHFNVSHAQAYSLVALSRSHAIGCDIEDRFEASDVDRLGPLVLHRDEAQAVNRLRGQERQDAFRRCWVRKEALLKAFGSGFLEDPRHVRAEDSALIVHEKQIDAGCAAAVAGTDAICAWHLLEPSEWR